MNQKIHKYKLKLTRRNNIYQCTVTKVANGLLSWSLSCTYKLMFAAC